MIRAWLLVVSITMNSSFLWSQTDSSFAKTDVSRKPFSLKIYKTHPKWEIPVSLALIGAASLGYKWMDQRASLTAEQVSALNPLNINSFDRPAAYYDPATFKNAQSKSDILMTAFVASPLFLVLDKRIRRDWADMLGMLLAVHAVDNTIFFSTLLLVRSPRPLTYNPALPLEAKTGVGKTNSFPSGHVSWTAASTFFIAKVYTDYHHIKGLKRMLFYTGAALPPTLIGYYRVHAGSHFPSDAIVGGLLGAVCGIVVPELHRITKKVDGLSLQPFSRSGSNGFSLSYTIK
jgi:membrane-associated phospholipid phosphatase